MAPAGLHGRARRIALEHDRAGLGLQGLVGRRPAGERAAPSERRDRHDDEVGVTRTQRRDVDRADRKVFDEQVGAGEQRVDARVIGPRDDGTFAGVEVAEQGAVLAGSELAGGGVRAQRVAGRWFDLDDVGAGIDEELRAVGAGDAGREVDDLDVAQRANARLDHGARR
jgi:hypothetical protein